MEKELLILGIVRREAIHGYRLWELLEAVPTGVRLKRSNAYRILDVLLKRGLVEAVVEQHGNRPERRVYSITSVGERAFQEMLRESLGKDAGSDLPNTVALNYLEFLSTEEAIELLKNRRETIEARVSDFSELSEAALNRHPGVGMAVSYDRFEFDFLTRLIDRLSKDASGS